MNNNDPFYLVKNQVEISLTGLNGLFSRWRGLSKSQATRNSEECRYYVEEVWQSERALRWAVWSGRKEPAGVCRTAP